MKNALKRMPLIGPVCRAVYFTVFDRFRRFKGSSDYWKTRYKKGGNSGEGSYDDLAIFKAAVLNDLTEHWGMKSVIEFGCGDGNQLRFARYPSYLGVDISPEAVSWCKQCFVQDVTKKFVVLDDYAGEKADMGLSLDVVYHLVEDDVFNDYMERLFSASTRMVVIYSSNSDVQYKHQGKHVRHRRFTDWIAANASDWELVRHIPNRYPYEELSERGSFADFFVYVKRNIDISEGLG